MFKKQSLSKTLKRKHKVKQQDPIEKFLNQVPPDFTKAERNGKANSVYDVTKLKLSELQQIDEEHYCEWNGLQVPSDDC